MGLGVGYAALAKGNNKDDVITSPKSQKSAFLFLLTALPVSKAMIKNSLPRKHKYVTTNRQGKTSSKAQSRRHHNDSSMEAPQPEAPQRGSSMTFLKKKVTLSYPRPIGPKSCEALIRCGRGGGFEPVQFNSIQFNSLFNSAQSLSPCFVCSRYALRMNSRLHCFPTTMQTIKRR